MKFLSLLGYAVLAYVVIAGSTAAQLKKNLVAANDGAILLNSSSSEIGFLDNFLPPQESIFRIHKALNFDNQGNLYFHRGLSFNNTSTLLKSPYLGQSWCKISYHELHLPMNTNLKIGSYNKTERNLPLTNHQNLKVAELSCMMSDEKNLLPVAVVPSLSVLQKAFAGVAEIQVPGVAKLF